MKIKLGNKFTGDGVSDFYIEVINPDVNTKLYSNFPFTGQPDRILLSQANWNEYYPDIFENPNYIIGLDSNGNRYQNSNDSSSNDFPGTYRYLPEFNTHYINRFTTRLMQYGKMKIKMKFYIRSQI